SPQGLAVGPVQVRDLRRDRPPLRRGGRQPGGVLEIGDHAVERLALRPEVGEQAPEQLRPVRHAHLRPGGVVAGLRPPCGGTCAAVKLAVAAQWSTVLLDAALLSTGMDDIPATARDLEARGYAGVWASEVAHDPFLQLLAAGQATERLQVGTAIAVAVARSPMTLATTAYDLQRYTRGRFALGLGTQIKAHVERRFSMPWSAPAARMREFVAALRAIWTAWQEGTRLRFGGEHYRHTRMTPMFSPPAHEFGPPPVYLAAVGPLMTQLAGEV